MQIAFGEPDTTWAKYGLEELPIMFAGRDTPYKAIVRNEKLVKILGRGYELFPNEEALKIADEAAKLVGLEPMAIEAPGLTVDGNVLLDKDAIRVRALYHLGRVEKIDGEEVNVALNVFNSIDGSTAFGCGIFTYRYICGNGVIYGKEKVLDIRRVHTKGLQTVVQDLKARMVLMLERGVDVLDSYRRMTEERVTEKLIDRILRTRLPKRVLPDYITEEEVILPDLTQWQLYNDITEAIWHNADTGLHTKTFQFNTLHKVTPLQVRRL